MMILKNEIIKIMGIVLFIALVLLTVASVRISKLQRVVNEASLWTQVVDIRINALQERSAAVQRECIALLDTKVADIDDRVTMEGYDCFIDKDYDQRVAVTPISPQGRVAVKTLHCEKYYK